TRHSAAFERAARVGAAAGAASVAMHLLHAVRGALPGEVVAFHHARVAATLAGADNVHRLDVGKQVNRHLLATLVAIGGAAELADFTLRLAIRLAGGLNAGGGTAARTLAGDGGHMTTLAATGAATGFVLEPQLDGRVAVAVLRPQLEHM